MDSRTQNNIASLNPQARPWAQAHLKAISESGILPKGYKVEIVSGNRTWEAQDLLFAQGRSIPGEIVTNARGGQSNHNFGIAWDIGIFDDSGVYLSDSPLYEKIAKVGKDMGLEWGGDWVTMVDKPHYQVRTGLSTSALRGIMQQGRKIPVPIYGGPLVQSEEPSNVIVLDHEKITDIPAHIEGGRVWVGLRKFCDRFGGAVKEADGDNAQIVMDRTSLSVALKIVEGVGYAKFADINRVLGWGYYYQNGRLIVDTKGVV